MIKSTFFIFMLLGMLCKGCFGEEDEFIDKCDWMAWNTEQTPPRINLFNHSNWKLLPVGRCGKQPYPRGLAKRVWGGWDVRNPWAYPWIARLDNSGKPLTKTGGRFVTCGGTIINEWWILTAAHCCENMRVGRSQWFLGSNNLVESRQNVGIKYILMHPDYNECLDSGFTKNDICLNKVNRKIQFSDRIQPICLPIRYGRETENGTEMVIAGFGRLHQNFTRPFKLQAKVVYMMTQEKCRNTVSSGVDAREICITSGSCRGDSGAPLMKYHYDDDDGTPTYYLYGVLATGDYDCRKNRSVAVRVTEYMQWIVDWLDV